MTDNHARLSSAQVETIAGLSAGTISTLAVHPLDVIKTRLQIQRNTSAAPVNAFTIFRSLALNSQNKNPIQTLYRGLTPNLVGNASSWAIFFYFKSIIESQIVQLHSPRSERVPASSTAITRKTSFPNDNNDAKQQTGAQSDDGGVKEGRDTLTPLDYFLASGLSGAIITLSTNPIWVLKTRMLSSDKGSEGAYESMWHGARQVLRMEGWRGFYRGAGVSLLGNSHGAVQFAVYEPLKNFWRRYVAQEGPLSSTAAATAAGIGSVREEKMGNTATLVISGSAKVVAGTVTYPLQVLRSRLQTYHAEKRYGKGISGVAQKVWREEGARGFYKGLGTNVVRVLPATWITFLVYENVRYYLPLWS